MPDCMKLDQFCHNPSDCELFGCFHWNAWPKCAVPACETKSCKSLRSKYCWPHTPGDALTAQQNLLETEIRVEMSSQQLMRYNLFVGQVSDPT